MLWYLYFHAGSLSDTSSAVFIFMLEVSLTHPCWLHFYLGTFSYTSRVCLHFVRVVSLTHWDAGFILVKGVSLTHPVLVLFLRRKFLLHIPYPMKPLFLFRAFVWHIQCCLHFYAGSFSYTSHASFIFI